MRKQLERNRSVDVNDGLRRYLENSVSVSFVCSGDKWPLDVPLEIHPANRALFLERCGILGPRRKNVHQNVKLNMEINLVVVKLNYKRA